MPDGVKRVFTTYASNVERATIRQGDALVVSVRGNCAKAVVVNAQNTRLVPQSVADSTRHVFIATRPGRVGLTASLSVCAQPRGYPQWSACRGPSERLVVLSVNIQG